MERSEIVAEKLISRSFVLIQILEYTGYTIHDVINDPRVRYEVTGYFRLYRRLERRCNELAEQAPQADQGKILL